MLFEDWTEQQLKDYIAALEDAVARGVRSVDFNGESIEYSTPERMRRTIRELRRALKKKQGQPVYRTRRILHAGSGTGWR